MNADRLARQAAFVHACDTDDVATVLLLLKSNLNANAISGRPSGLGWGCTKMDVLQAAAQRGSLAVVQALASSGRVGIGRRFGATALYRACANGQAKCARALLSMPGADPDDGCDDADTEFAEGGTPLIGAAEGGHHTCVELLLAARADVDATGHERRTAFMRAILGGHTRCAQLLVPATAAGGAAECVFGCRPLAYATLSGDTVSIKAILALDGIDVNHCSSHAAIRNARSRGFQMDENDAFLTSTALVVAVRGGHLEGIKLLLSAAGIDVNHGFEGYEVPILQADGLDCVRAIALAKGVCINVGDVEDRCLTALHKYCSLLQAAEAEVLLVAGACRFQNDTDGATALDWARDAHDRILHVVRCNRPG